MEETRYVIEYKEFRRNRWHAAFTTYSRREAQLALWDLAEHANTVGAQRKGNDHGRS